MSRAVARARDALRYIVASGWDRWCEMFGELRGDDRRPIHVDEVCQIAYDNETQAEWVRAVEKLMQARMLEGAKR